MSGATSPPPAQPTTTTASASTSTLPLPLGFSAQIKALQEAQHALTHRITVLENENAALKATVQLQSQSHAHPQPQHQPSPLSTITSRIEALEAHNTHLQHRRREAVAQLLSLRTLHQESANAVLVRAADIEDDDLEGMLGVYGTSVTTVLNQHQRALGQLRGAPIGYVSGCWPMGYAHVLKYGPSGFCYAHAAPYPCRGCGQ